MEGLPWRALGRGRATELSRKWGGERGKASWLTMKNRETSKPEFPPRSRPSADSEGEGPRCPRARLSPAVLTDHGRTEGPWVFGRGTPAPSVQSASLGVRDHRAKLFSHVQSHTGYPSP